MRENKYRAWDKQDKRMIVNTQKFIPLIVTSYGVLRLSATHEETLYSLVDPDRFEIMQYTGINDKNGVEIYEWDIVERKNIGNGTIVFGPFATLTDDWNVEEDSPKFCIVWPDDSGYSSLCSDCKVIGNIYENPELLNG